MEIRISIITFLSLCIVCRASDSSFKSDDCATFDQCLVGEDMFRTCSCDSDCHDYGTCCADSDNSHEMPPPDKARFRCHSDRTATPVYAKRTCLDTFVAHPGHRHMCEEAEADRADVLGNVLVTSVRTKTTYWNRDCGICNDEDPDNLRFWTVQVTCPSKHGDTRFNQNYIERHLSFDKDIEEWGLKVEDGFKVCSLVFFQPRGMAGRLSYCAPNLVSGCPPEFPDAEVVEECKSYHAERRRKSAKAEYFRNVHCALCNGIEEHELDCVGRSYGPVDSARGRDVVRVSFDQEWLEKEGLEKYKCSRNNSWDPFTNRCRRLPEDLWKQLYATPTPTSQAHRATAHVIVFVFACILYNKYGFK